VGKVREEGEREGRRERGREGEKGEEREGRGKGGREGRQSRTWSQIRMEWSEEHVAKRRP
jgi:hypothetical protein